MNLIIPKEIEDAIRAGAAIVVSVSGGKDSDALTYQILAWLKAQGLTNSVHLVHADLGRAELKATPAHVEELAARTKLPLAIVRHTKFDLVGMIRNRMKTRPEVPPWPSAQNRQCTSDQKRDPISKWIRNTFPTGRVVCAMGLRADESAARAKKPVSSLRLRCCSKDRTVWDWNPIHRQTIENVWAAIGNNPRHPAYDAKGDRPGNNRVSCALCILADEDDLLNGALQDVELFREYCDIEIESGFSFRDGFWLGVMAPHLLREDQKAFYKEKVNK